MLIHNKKISFETLDYLWSIAPFSIRFCDSKKESNSLSIHKDVEIHCVFEGKEAYTLNGVEHLIGKDSLICVNSYVPHNYYTIEQSRSVTIVISTDFLIRNGFDPSKACLNECIVDAKACALFLEIADELKRNDYAHNITMHARVLQFVAYIVRKYSHERIAGAADGLKLLGSVYEYVCVAIDYISENFTSTIGLDELAALCGLSKYHFIRIFRQVTGYTPGSYINRVRTNYAKQLLLNGVNVTEAAIASGFSDVHYFSNCFKKYKGCRPSEIKKNLKSDL